VNRYAVGIKQNLDWLDVVWQRVGAELSGIHHLFFIFYKRGNHVCRQFWILFGQLDKDVGKGGRFLVPWSLSQMILVEFYRNDLEKGLQVFFVLSQRLLALD